MTMFSRGIGEPTLPTSTHWSTCARVLLPHRFMQEPSAHYVRGIGT
jgi:hypothetical protein